MPMSCLLERGGMSVLNWLTMEPHEQDRYLPIANISRIMKRSIPGSAKISREAKECVQECVSEFIAFITSEASDKCKLEKRKTINGDDLLYAMTALGFERYTEPLRSFLNRYRDVVFLHTDVFLGKSRWSN
ncbi:uncharacterized protein [Blastocystis hominis]|uniref:Transcription factor CBF/NF-Y/archaeal histone domain-containing protein n=1 Tax=Blastocystis hominis TaxID=12968 RepID=D8M3T0_BLAHO|nr:uncharacterized protein [Blastocystis hominis]CBK22553.2 unnamed protein product [Blastocystis hominis]|eukprot:XP_012896601.1 uncharacterized protein [Blastocystis hominis]